MNKWQVVKELLFYKWYIFKDEQYSYYELSSGDISNSVVRLVILGNTLVEIVPKYNNQKNRVKNNLFVLILKLLESEKIEVEKVIIEKNNVFGIKYRYSICYKSKNNNSIQEMHYLNFKNKFSKPPYYIKSKILRISKLDSMNLKDYPKSEEVYLSFSNQITLPNDSSKIIFNGGNGILADGWECYPNLTFISFYNVHDIRVKSLQCLNIEVTGSSKNGFQYHINLNNETKIKNIVCNYVDLKIKCSSHVIVDSIILNDSRLIGCKKLSLKRVHMRDGVLILKNNNLKFLSISQNSQGWFRIATPQWELTTDSLIQRLTYFRKKTLEVNLFSGNLNLIANLITSLNSLGTYLINIDHIKFSFKKSIEFHSKNAFKNNYLEFLMDLKHYNHKSEVKNLARLILVNTDKEIENSELINTL